MKCRIIYNKNNCVGAGECEVIAPHLWKVDNGKANLLQAKEISKGTFEIQIDEAEYIKQKDVVATCPVGCIKVIKTD